MELSNLLSKANYLLLKVQRVIKQIIIKFDKLKIV